MFKVNTLIMRGCRPKHVHARLQNKLCTHTRPCRAHAVEASQFQKQPSSPITFTIKGLFSYYQDACKFFLFLYKEATNAGCYAFLAHTVTNTNKNKKDVRRTSADTLVHIKTGKKQTETSTWAACTQATLV